MDSPGEWAYKVCGSLCRYSPKTIHSIETLSNQVARMTHPVDLSHFFSSATHFFRVDLVAGIEASYEHNSLDYISPRLIVLHVNV